MLVKRPTTLRLTCQNTFHGQPHGCQSTSGVQNTPWRVASMTYGGKTDAVSREWGELPSVIHRIPPFRSLTGPDQRLDSLGRHLGMMGENLEHHLDHARDRR